ncbi:uncharacterized protein LOC128210870 [Mya arenaria]|uniref:uncharacterized protein LOC128210870 n=1 Tax=Mya arenaria TaxID=6604 RepID=UPI0022E3C6E0|nr:uncharacterized protein LOC128210870 [Mya arenaria]
MSEAIDDEIFELKLQKSRCKSAFTKTKNKLLSAVSIEEELEKEEIRTLEQEFDKTQEDVSQIFEKLCVLYKGKKDNGNLEKTQKEMEINEAEYSKTYETVQNLVEKSILSDSDAGLVHEDPKEDTKLGNDMWRQMKRVSIPVFNGDKKKYQAWFAAFSACIHNAPATKEYKLLQLRQYISGSALKAVEDLGHSAAAYDAALELLERKFGGERRQVARYLEELEKFTPMKEENVRSIEKLADLVDLTVVNLTDAKRLEDLKDGALYIRIKKKLPENMLTRYHRYIHVNSEEESVIALRKWLLQEAEFHTRAAETVYGMAYGHSAERQCAERHGAEKQYGKQRPQHRSFVTRNKETCVFCNSDGHVIWKCSRFKSLPVNRRWEIAKEARLCFRCLGDDHHGGECKWDRRCGINGCPKNHNRLLHADSRPAQKNNQNEAAGFQRTAMTHTSTFVSRKDSTPEKRYIALRTVPVIVKHGGRHMQINALLDDGSTKTYINEDVACELGVQGRASEMTVNVLNGISDTFQTMPVSVGLESLNGHVNMNVDANTTRNVTGTLKTINWNEEGQNYPHLHGIKFPCIKNDKVDMLIGSDYAQLHYSLHEIKGAPNEPIARLTPLGWTCVGPYSSSGENNTFNTFFQSDIELNNTLKQFWEVDSSGTTENNVLTVNEKKVIEKTEKTVKYENEMYTVGLPWKEVNVSLPDNYDSALKRLENTEKRLKKNPVVFSAYQKTLENYEEKGYIRRVKPSAKNNQGWYLPHFPVIRLDKETTKIRVVFDASAKCQDVSLNDKIEQGPKLQRNLFDVLLRFRRHEIALICDIQEMYLRVGIIESDKKFQRFLWRTDPEDPPTEYEFNRVVFGVNASPFLAQFIAQRNAKEYENDYPRAAETVLKSTYMDDSMDSVCTEKDGVELYKQLSSLWSKAGMYARKWLSNSAAVLENIPQADRLKEVDLSEGGLPAVKTLGVLWVADDDQFTFRVSGPLEGMQFTKRTFLSKISSLYDPLGFLAPFTVRAKLLMQDIWVSGIDWDQKLSQSDNFKVIEWFEELKLLPEIRIPRCINMGLNTDDFEIHTFVDASSKAVGTVVYGKSSNGSSAVITQIVAKSKVAPITSVSIPRLELMAAILGLKTTVNVCRAIEIDMSHVTFWSDSMNVLWWIRGQSRRYKPFVANRVGEIHEKSSPNQLRYVPSSENPADIVSRGMSVDSLVESKMWWQGPGFLKDSVECWPKNPVVKGSDVDVEMKKSLSVEENCTFLELSKRGPMRSDDHSWRLIPERFSSWTRLVRVCAWVYRFVTNCVIEKQSRATGELTVCEIRNAEIVIIKQAQNDCFKEKIANISRGQKLSNKSKLVGLNPVLDQDELVRSDGRLKYAEFLSYDIRFPIILPRKHWVTKLIVKHHHEQGFHVAGTSQTLASLSLRFWILSGREAIREWENECMKCRRRKAQPATQIMAPLPDIRLRNSMKAFCQVAVDFGGPYITVQGRGRRRKKRYLCLFTCLMSRAVHLEVAFGLDTSSFMNAFYRMVNRRGLPKEMISDNGTNFVGADRELQELVAMLDTSKISEDGANKGIQWHFNPPLAPHFGGVHEIMIKAAKRAAFAVLKGADVTDEELITAFTGVEALLNSRPLTYQTANPLDQLPLTPNHFLFGQAGGHFAPESVDTTDYSPQKRWRRLQELVRHFWGRWMREWLPSLTSRKKWYFPQRDLKEGDVVLVISPDTPRGHWPMGRIEELHKGKDGRVRVASVRVKDTTYTRSITK